MPHPHAGARHGRWAPRGRAWWIGVLFAVGSVCFLVAPFPRFEQAVAVGAYLVPSTGREVSVAAADLGTSFGALCFLVGALLLLPVATARTAPRRCGAGRR